MPVNLNRLRKRQKLKHFIYTFMNSYNTETAADKTMRSQYVPRNLKLKLMEELNDCKEDRSRIEDISDMGLYIHAACNEIVYYHSITGFLIKWILSAYVASSEIKNICQRLIVDVGKITDEDIRFILSKYRYDRELKAEGRQPRESIDSLMSMFRDKKHSPEKSILQYYGSSMWFRIIRVTLRNSINIFNGTYGSVFDNSSRSDNGGTAAGDENRDNVAGGGLSSDDTPLPADTSDLYRDFMDRKAVFLRMSEETNCARLRDIVDDTMLESSRSSSTSDDVRNVSNEYNGLDFKSQRTSVVNNDGFGNNNVHWVGSVVEGRKGAVQRNHTTPINTGNTAFDMYDFESGGGDNNDDNKKDDLSVDWMTDRGNVGLPLLNDEQNYKGDDSVASYNHYKLLEHSLRRESNGQKTNGFATISEAITTSDCQNNKLTTRSYVHSYLNDLPVADDEEDRLNDLEVANIFARSESLRNSVCGDDISDVGYEGTEEFNELIDETRGEAYRYEHSSRHSATDTVFGGYGDDNQREARDVVSKNKIEPEAGSDVESLVLVVEKNITPFCSDAIVTGSSPSPTVDEYNSSSPAPLLTPVPSLSPSSPSQPSLWSPQDFDFAMQRDGNDDVENIDHDKEDAQLAQLQFSVPLTTHCYQDVSEEKCNDFGEYLGDDFFKNISNTRGSWVVTEYGILSNFFDMIDLESRGKQEIDSTDINRGTTIVEINEEGLTK